MKSFRKMAAATLMALIAVTSVTACDETTGIESTGSALNAPNNTTSATTTSGVPSTMKDEDAQTISEIELQEFNLENKTIKFLSSWAMNPANGKAVPVALEMFQQKYGGKVEDIIVPWDAKFDKLGAMISSGDSPDFYSAADLDMFPNPFIPLFRLKLTLRTQKSPVRSNSL
ncbi:MAG: hypothetical protein ACI4KM_01770 [Oscillospiraceae bacterium]